MRRYRPRLEKVIDFLMMFGYILFLLLAFCLAIGIITFIVIGALNFILVAIGYRLTLQELYQPAIAISLVFGAILIIRHHMKGRRKGRRNDK
jgi:hypothetical protein